MTINAEFKARIVMPGEEFDAADIPADSLKAFCERPAGAPRATILEAAAPVPSAPPKPPIIPLEAPAAVSAVAPAAPPAPKTEPVAEEKKSRRSWRKK